MSVAAIFLVRSYLKKTKKRLYILHTIIGAIAFGGILAAMFSFMRYAFSEIVIMQVTVHISESLYKILLSVGFFLAVGIVRYVVVDLLYYNREYRDQGTSFLIGYGIAGCMLIAIYCLFMLTHVIYQASVSDFVALEESMLLFKDEGRIVVFTPFISHVFLALVFAVYTGFMIVISIFMDLHSRKPYKGTVTFRMFLLTHGSELIMSAIMLFASASLNMVIIAVIFIIISVLAALSVKYLYKYEEKLPYDKQFE